MTVMDRRTRKLLDFLVELAGDSETVVEVLRELNEQGRAPTVDDVVEGILKRRPERMAHAAALVSK